MRLDSFLKVSGILKRRALAKELAEAGRVRVDGRVAKGSTTVRPGQEITVDLARRVLTYRVLRVGALPRGQEHGIRRPSALAPSKATSAFGPPSELHDLPAPTANSGPRKRAGTSEPMVELINETNTEGPG